ncbi:hypothetical protein FQA39_LY13035 [Lamprigera yunnana]|nr:hypothetical protein FQA39_LY13035 [Lamprigera yunnana]
MAKNKVVVKKLSVIQNMGSLDVLTTDKTGTLTKDEMEFVKCIDINDEQTNYLNQLVYTKISAIELLADKQFDHLRSIEEMLEKISSTKDEQQKINTLIKKYVDDGYKVLVVASALTNKIIDSNLKFEGDDQQNSLNVAKGIQLNPITLMSGEELNSAPKDLIQASNIFYKMSPLDKAYVVKELQDYNHVVGFLGDGVNDVIALKKADVGITVNNATPLAKASSDIILLEKNLDVLEGSFIKGREIFTNAMKYIKITVAANFGIMLTLLISAFWFKFSVMSPIQLLIQNLIFDFANLVFVLDKVDEIELESPKK